MTEHAWVAECEAEIVSLHRFFVDWFRGRCEDADDVWRTFEDKLTPDFVLVSPDAVVLPRAVLVPALRAHHGQHATRRFEIDVKNVELRHVGTPLVVVGYEEWQWIGARRTARRSTAVFRHTPDATPALRWAHVHETWIPEFAP